MIPGLSVQGARGPVGPAAPGRGTTTTIGGVDLQSVMLIVGVSMALGLLLAAVAALYYKRRRRRRKHRAALAPKPVNVPSTADQDHSGRRRHRREHRPRNPSLAERGGLPPIREGLPPTPPP